MLPGSNVDVIFSLAAFDHIEELVPLIAKINELLKSPKSKYIGQVTNE